MPYLITTFLCVFGVIYRKSSVVYFIILLWMWILFGWNTDNADFANYSFTYYHILALVRDTGYELGYFFLITQANLFNLDYEDFLKIVSLVGLLLVSSTIRKYSRYPAYVLVFYILSVYFINIVQMRSFLASAIVIYGIRFLVNRSKNGTVLYVLFVFLAATIHFSSLYYLIFACIPFVSRRLIIYGSAIAAMCSSLIVSSGLIQSLTARLTDSDKVSTWMASTYLFSYIFLSSFQILTLLIVSMYYKYYINVNGLEKNKFPKSSEARFMDTMYLINWMLMTTTGFYLLGGVFTRLYTNLLPLNLIVFSIVAAREYRGRTLLDLNRLVLNLIYVFMILAFVVLLYVDGTIIPIMSSNSFFDSIF